MKHVLIGALCVALAGCANVGGMPHITGTQTDLSQKNYRVVKSAVQGIDKGFSLLGLITLQDPSYANAMSDLHRKIAMEGKAYALANVAQDRSRLYLLLFSIPQITITADIIEFVDPEQDSE